MCSLAGGFSSATVLHAVLLGRSRMAMTSGTLLGMTGFCTGWQNNQDHKRPKGVAGAAVCLERSRLKNAPIMNNG